LSAFTAALEGDEAVLVWTTASEENNAGFDVERSLDGGAFERLGFVEGAGTTETARQYRFTDRALPFDADVAAYRLRQIDTDGTVAVSDEEARAGRIEYRIPTTNLASGLYFLRLETAQGTQTQRLSVVR
jgi:hypothetical protein